jgi:hypothetical protein
MVGPRVRIERMLGAPVVAQGTRRDRDAGVHHHAAGHQRRLGRAGGHVEAIELAAALVHVAAIEQLAAEQAPRELHRQERPPLVGQDRLAAGELAVEGDRGGLVGLGAGGADRHREVAQEVAAEHPGGLDRLLLVAGRPCPAPLRGGARGRAHERQLVEAEAGHRGLAIGLAGLGCEQARGRAHLEALDREPRARRVGVAQRGQRS